MPTYPTNPVRCIHCGGNGTIAITYTNYSSPLHSIIPPYSPCPDCRGIGYTVTDLCSCCYGKGETVQVGQTQPSLCSYCQGTGARIIPAIFPLPKTLFNDVGYKDHKYRIDAMLKSHLMVATDPDVKAPPTDEVGIRMASLDVSEGKLCAVEKEESGRFGLLEVDESSGIFNRLEVD